MCEQAKYINIYTYTYVHVNNVYNVVNIHEPGNILHWLIYSEFLVKVIC